MAAVNGRLIITVVDAKGLNSDQYGKVDPYCKVTLPALLIDDTFKTKACKKPGNSPVWEESHAFNLNKVKLDTKIKFELYDHDVFKNEYLGAAEVALGELLHYKGKIQYYHLLEKRPDNRVAGYIGIVTEFDDHDLKEHQTHEKLGAVIEQKVQCKCAPGECRCTGECACKKPEVPTQQITDASKTLNGLLTITVVDAKDVDSPQYGKDFPYCKVILPGLLINDTFTTKDCKKSGNSPVWEESHAFKLNKVKLDTKIKFELYDHDVFKNEYLGAAEVYLNELLENKGKLHYYKLIEKRPDHRVAGYIGIVTEFDDHDLKEDLAHIREKMHDVAIGQKVQGK